jgi:hypothetical protein
MKIKRIEILFNDANDCISWSVGFNGVTKIIDCSSEFESFIEFVYNVYIDEKLTHRLINPRCHITYEETNP